MKKRFISLMLGVTLVASTLTGCNSEDTAKISELNTMTALNSESSVTSSYNLSYSDEQEMIYEQVINRQLLDLSTLIACEDSDVQQVLNYMNLVDNQLIGSLMVNNYKDAVTKFVSEGLVEDETVLDSTLTDYLLSFMQQTPYYWQRTKTTIRGKDNETHSVVVDVDYKTTKYEKEVRLDSSICLGDPDYDRLSESRYNKWMAIVNSRIYNPSNRDLPKMEADFAQYFGDIEVILEEQNEYTPTVRIYHSGNQETYSGLIDSSIEQQGGTMTVRYILVPNYVLGLNMGLTCEHMYITRFALDNGIPSDTQSFTQEGYQTVTDSVYNLIYSYFTCIDESDYNGLYKLTTDFNKVDKHWDDVFKSTYQKHNGFSVSLFDIEGTHITCGVTISTKERAKCSNMTYPAYTDRYFVEMELEDDILKISNLVLLSRTLDGEPAISDEEVDTTGFTAMVALNNDDRVAIENLICNFSALQLNGDTTSDSFSDVVDTSISTNELNSLREHMLMLSGVQKVVFLQTYMQGTSNFAAVRCKELYKDATNAIVEATVTYNFILKGGRWFVYRYDINSSIKLDSTSLATTGSLCLVEPGKVVSYTSQIKSSVATNLDEVSDISLSFDHAEYPPILKSGIAEEGRVLIVGSDIVGTYWETCARVLSMAGTSQEDFEAKFDRLNEIVAGTDYEGLGTEVLLTIYDTLAIYLNEQENRYADAVTQVDTVTAQTDVIDELSDRFYAVQNNADRSNNENVQLLQELFNLLQTVERLM